MKKRIILLLTFIVSFIMCTDIAKAANVQELTCVYDKTDSQPGIKFTIDKNGNGNLYISPSNVSGLSAKTNWIQQITNDRLYVDGTAKSYTSCPVCINYNSKSGQIEGPDGKEDGKGNCKTGAGTLNKELSKLTADDTHAYEIYGASPNLVINEKPQNDDEVINGTWVKKCVYKKDNNRIEIYFNRNEFVLYDNNISILYGNKTETKIYIETKKFTINNDHTLEQLVKRYNENLNEDQCYAHVYKSTKCSNPNERYKKNKKYETSYYKGSKTTNSNQEEYVRDDVESKSKTKPVKEEITTCEALIGKSTIELINTIMKYIRIAVPLLLIGFGVSDFAIAVFSSKEEDTKKSREKFIKRIIAAVLVFLSPIFINLLLSLANEVWTWITPETCIK